MMQESSSISGHLILTHLHFTPFLSPFPKSASIVAFNAAWFPYLRTDVLLETIFAMREKKKNTQSLCIKLTAALVQYEQR